MRYYDLKKKWNKVSPHLDNPEVKAVLTRDFNKFTYGQWKKPFVEGQYPHDFENCDWWLDHKGPMPRFWRYVKLEACHWLVNFNLTLAMLAEPKRPWRIITSEKHSTVWDGDETLFDFNFLALGVSPDECFELALEIELPPGVRRKVGFAQSYKVYRREDHEKCLIY
jgi:hypothetical protein